MGTELSSVGIDGVNKPFIQDYTILYKGNTLADKKLKENSFEHFSQNHQKNNTPIKTSFHGIWSMFISDSLGPNPRHYQCGCYYPSTNSIFIAYGNDNENYFNDCWYLNLQNFKWKCFSKKLLSPRSGCESILIKDNLFIFGGEFNGIFYDDLHYINLKNSEIKKIETFGNKPTPRRNPVLGYFNNQLFLWGGYNGENPRDIFKLDLMSLIWTSISINCLGRSFPAHVTFHDSIFIFGSSKNQGLIKLNMNNSLIESIESTGTMPNFLIDGSKLLNINNKYLILIGGKSEYSFTHIYGYDIERKWWFIFHIKPDEETLSYEDGEIIDIGLFMIPREFGFSTFYSSINREIIIIFGNNLLNPLPIFKIFIGNALSILHHRNDMLDLLNINK